MASPTCTVNTASTANGVNVTPATTVTIALASTAGVTLWSIACVYTDETSDAAAVTASLVINNILKTATFTAPAAGKAYVFRSQVNGGLDDNGSSNASLTTTFGVYTLTAASLRVVAANETTEQGAFGWAGPVNAKIRQTAGGGGAPTGTGFPHITGGVQDAAAVAIDLATAHVTGVLPVANRAAPTAVEVQAATAALASSLDVNAQKVINSADATTATGLTTKQQMDAADSATLTSAQTFATALVNQRDIKDACRASSSTNVNLAAPGATIGTVTMASGDRFFAYGQTSGLENGPYVWNGAATPATRTTDADSSAEVTQGMLVPVVEGTDASAIFELVTADPIVLNTTALTFSIINAGNPTRETVASATSVNAVAANIDVTLEDNSVYTFEDVFTGRRNTGSSDGNRKVIVKVTTLAGVLTIGTDTIVAEDPAGWNTWTHAYSAPGGLVLRRTFTGEAAKTIVFVRQSTPSPNPSFATPPTPFAAAVPTTRQVIAGDSLTVNATTAAALSGDVTIARDLSRVTTAISRTSLSTDQVVDVTANGTTQTLEASPVTSRRVRFFLPASNTGTTFSGNGHNINGAATYTGATGAYDVIDFEYNGTEWRLV